MVSAKWCSMTIESHQSQEKLKVAADISSALARQIAELLELREVVRKAELSTACKQQNCKKPGSGRAGCSCRPSGRWAEITRRHEPAALRSVGLAQFLAEKLHDHQRNSDGGGYHSKSPNLLTG